VQEPGSQAIRPGRAGDAKVMDIDEAVATLVRPGDVLHIAYSDARPMAAMMALVRVFAGTDPGFSLVTSGLVSVQHALVETGIVKHVTASFIGENYPVARPSPAFSRAFRNGDVAVSNWSMWSLISRLMAGALGLPYMPTRSLTGSSMFTQLSAAADVAQLDNPFGGGPTTVVRALNPDIVLLHGVAADRLGNVVLSAPYGEAQWGALAARRGVIATVERIVAEDEILAHSALVKVPAHVVRAVCPVPLGSHPYGLYNPGFGTVASYAEDHEFIDDVFVASKSAESFRAWIDEWVLGVPNHDGYLRKLGDDRIRGLSAAHAPALPEAASGPAGGGWTVTEMQVVATARRIVERVHASPFDAILAGVGLANLASWSATQRLRDEGTTVHLMAELGMFGYVPKPGDPFIFAHQNLSTCSMVTDVPTVLGALVGGPGTRSLGVLGAGQVDGDGNTNSTFDQAGNFIVGSGGANDVASGADEVLLTVAHKPARLPKHLPYVTCPGTNVQSIVTSGGVFGRNGSRFVLLRYLPADRDEAVGDAVERLRAGCGWDFDVAPHLAAEPSPTPGELAVLRGYDPRRVFI
jgi:acyl CoA:acetate/3-ketoacid CoA transferase alpha subunit/acyl CoA:acetate/3-ketoacid CoA transferase beta subunit